MLEFVIYDDEKLFREKVVKVVNEVMKNNKKEYIISEYANYSERFKETIENNNNKIYIMDIEIPNSMSGIDISRIIRRNDWNSLIILITSHVEMGYEALKAQIMLLDFISKYNNWCGSLKNILKKAMNKIDNKKVITFNYNGITHRIYVDDIIYIYKDSVDRKAIIVTEYNKVYINETISNILLMLDHRFFLTHRSCIVNIEKIVSIDWSQNIIYFSNDIFIDFLSRDKRKELKEYVS